MLFRTEPLQIVDAPADAQHKGGKRPMAGVRFCIIHHTGGSNSLKWLTTDSPPSNPVSVHRLISRSGTIYKLVSDDEEAWHAGRGYVGPLVGSAKGQTNLNRCSLGIELENLGNGQEYPPEQIGMAVVQCVEWIGAYGPLIILGHAEVDGRKHDPRGLDMDWFRLRVMQVCIAQAKVAA